MTTFLSKLFLGNGSSKTPRVGFDISSHSVRFVELIQSGSGYKLGKFGERRIPSGGVENGKIKDIEGLREVLNSLRAKYGFKNINVSIPGGKTHFIRMNPSRLSGEDVGSAVSAKVADYLPPTSTGDFFFDYTLISENELEYDVEVSLFPIGMKEEYSKLFEGTGLRPFVFEPEEKAISRAVLSPNDKETHMIVDLGKKQTGVFVVSQGVPMFAAALGMGEEIIIDSIRERFGVSLENAEKMKKEYGLNNNLNDQEFSRAITKPLSLMKDEIDKLFVYWHSHASADGNKSERIDSIIMCGGGADLPGLSDYLSANLKVPVSVANVWTNVNSFEEYIPEISKNDSFSYAASIGLALRGVYGQE